MAAFESLTLVEQRAVFAVMTAERAAQEREAAAGTAATTERTEDAE